MLTACSRDASDLAGTSRDDCQWGEANALVSRGTGEHCVEPLLAGKLVGSVGSAGIGNHRPLGLRSAGWLDPAGTVTLAALLAVEVAAVGAVGPAGDRPGAGGGLGGVAFGVQLHHHPGTEHRVVLGTAHPLGQLTAGPCSDRELIAVEGHKLWVQARRGRPVRWRAASIARWRTASGLRAGIPRPWRVNALRSDGQVVPSSAAAALTLPSRSARAKACSASARSTRNRLGCQPSGWRSCRRPSSAAHPAMSGADGGRCRAARRHRVDTAAAAA
jgi:hypothetical protein